MFVVNPVFGEKNSQLCYSLIPNITQFIKSIKSTKAIKMPTGGCFCGKVTLEYSGEPAMTV